jgi:hypothetical protein
MYVNGKMIPVEIVPRIGEGEDKGGLAQVIEHLYVRC